MNRYLRNLGTLSSLIIIASFASALAQPKDGTEYFRALQLMGKEQYDEALAILKTIKYGEFSCDAIDNIIQIYKSRNDLRTAQGYFASVAASDSRNTSSLYGMAQIAHERKEYDTAITLLKQAIDREADHPYVYSFLSRCYISAGKTNDMVSYFQKLLTRDTTNVLYWYGLGRAYHRIDNLEQALRSYDKALQIRPDFELAGTLKQHICGNIGRFQEAIAIGLHLLRNAKASENLIAIADITNNLGVYYERIGNFPKALLYYGESLKHSRNLGLRVDQGRTLGNIISIYAQLGDPQAVEYFPQAMHLANETHHPDEIARHYLNIGGFYRSVGDNVRALESFQKALKTLYKFGIIHKGYVADLLLNIGDVYGETNNFGAALDSIHKALKLAKEQHDASIEANCLLHLGSIYAKIKQLDLALSFYTQSLEINQEIQVRHSEADCWNRLGEIFQQMNNYPEASRAHLRALAIGQELGIDRIAWEAYSGLAKANEATGKYADALQNYKLAIGKIDSARGELHAEEFKSGFHESKLHIYEGFIKLLARLHSENLEAGYSREAFYYAERAKARTLLDREYQGQVFQNLNDIDEGFRLQFLANATNLMKKH